MKKEICYRLKEKIFKVGEKWDKLAFNKEDKIEDIIAFAHKYINDEPNRYEKNYDSIDYELAHYGESINKKIREGYLDAQYYDIKNMISENQTKKDLVLFRGVSDYEFNNVIYNLTTNASKMECDLCEHAFLSTSLVKEKELPTNHRFRIFVPKGTHVKYMGNVNDEEQRYFEVVIQSGAKLKIVSMDKIYINCLLLETN